jgi:hypothetical protein
MDTNDLTQKAYEILIQAENINHLITVHIGVICNRNETENAFLEDVLIFLKHKIDKPINFIEDWGIDDEIDVETLRIGLSKLISYVEKTIKTPMNYRGPTIEEIDFG